MIDDDGIYKINLYITPKCKLKCEYCTLYDNTLNTPEFNYQEWDKLLKYLDKVDIHIYGGEPLESENIYEVLDFLTNHKNVNSTSILSNWLGLTHKIKKYNVNLLLSYHPKIEFYKFVKIVNEYKDQIVRISYMFGGDSERRFTEFKLLDSMYEFDTIFCPILYFGKDHSESIKMLRSHRDMLDKLIESKNYHFIEAYEGDTTFHLQEKFGMFQTFKEGIRECSITKYMIEIYNNKIYKCTSELHYNIGTSREGGEDFSKIEDLINERSCNVKNCAVFDHKYIIKK